MVRMPRFGCALALLLPACGGIETVDEGTSTGDDVPVAVRSVLSTNCFCHAGAAAAGDGISFDAGIPPDLVVWGDPEASRIIEVVLPGADNPMPPGGYETMSDEDRSVLIAWVLGILPFDGETTGAGESGEPDPTSADSDATESEGSTGSDLILCSLEVIDPSATSPVVYGDKAGVLPTAIGEALERNCGCHYLDEADSPYLAYNEGQPLRTLADFTEPYAGTNTAYADQPGWVSVQDRVINQGSMPMPICETQEPGNITDADLALFRAWFEQEAPDSASFVPPA